MCYKFNMISVAQVVEDIIISTPFVEEAIQKGLLNFSGFAREYKKYIEQQTMKSVTVGSIVMALRRRVRKNIASKSVKEIFRTSPDIIVRSNLFEITLPNSAELFSQQKKLIALSEETPNSLLTITHGVYETTVIVSAGIMKKIETLFPKKSIVAQVEDISAITILFPKNIVETPGIIYMILNVVAWNGVNLVEVVSTYSEFTLVVKKADVDRVFALIAKLFA